MNIDNLLLADLIAECGRAVDQALRNTQQNKRSDTGALYETFFSFVLQKHGLRKHPSVEAAEYRHVQIVENDPNMALPAWRIENTSFNTCVPLFTNMESATNFCRAVGWTFEVQHWVQ